eukprot:CAMPEP_0173421468 /NCGR_PEP_ID=MMETSP1357-20121228/2573_1 /TAXON_ID=77926 /ORGANISM="Hemiselmis rufescens, Strain PCC563" /LENGTH=311 /DNA_ID=CAMNT_0014384383 /DNA_START=112 /DNA_END=1044 /DNA_ORIENTATION=+
MSGTMEKKEEQPEDPSPSSEGEDGEETGAAASKAKGRAPGAKQGGDTASKEAEDDAEDEDEDEAGNQANGQKGGGGDAALGGVKVAVATGGAGADGASAAKEEADKAGEAGEEGGQRTKRPPGRPKGAKDTRPRTRRRKAEIAALRQTAAGMKHGMDMSGGGIPHGGMMGIQDKDFRAVHAGAFATQLHGGKVGDMARGFGHGGPQAEAWRVQMMQHPGFYQAGAMYPGFDARGGMPAPGDVYGGATAEGYDARQGAGFPNYIMMMAPKGMPLNPHLGYAMPPHLTGAPPAAAPPAGAAKGGVPGSAALQG